MASFDRIELRGVCKSYGSVRALVNVDLDIRQGESLGLLGSNGAGKSTLLHVLSRMVRPTRGAVCAWVGDAHAPLPHCGVVGHAPLLYPDLTGRENLQLFCQIHGVAVESADRWRDAFDLDGFVDRVVHGYSRGQLQRLSLARALCGRPEVLVLDEPLTGLDRASAQAVLSVLGELRSEGLTVVFSSHGDTLVNAMNARTVTMVRGRVHTDSRSAL